MIYGERIRLRAVERDDMDKFYLWVNDPDVRDGLSIYLPMSRADEQAWFDGLAKRDQAEKPLAIEKRSGYEWQLIGNCGLFSIEWNTRCAELGIMLGEKSVWNQGYGSDAVRLLVRHGFETLNLNRIFLHVHSDNPRAIRAYEKCGFVHEGRLRQAVYKHGHYEDLLVMGLLASEWKA
jgi:RimJ/RimL family protein N-acetyltransferase